MRIRRRPNSTSSPTFLSLLAPDPSNPVQSLGATAARGEENKSHLQERLHQDVDLPKKAQLLTDPSNSTFVQTKNKEKNMEKKKEEDEEEMVPVGSKLGWDHAEVHSNNNNKSPRPKLLANGTHQANKSKEITANGNNIGESEEKTKATHQTDKANTSTAITSCNRSSNANGASDQNNNESEAAKDKGNSGSGSGRKRRNPAVLMEGSRCSRVNGRGWRCSQPTLVGYALCEHHLGKGRMRSIGMVRGQLGTTSRVKSYKTGKPSTSEAVHDLKPKEMTELDRPHEDNAIAVASRKRKKTAAVKARSISSLLDKSDGDQTILLTESRSPRRPSSPPQFEAALLLSLRSSNNAMV